jgi:hypothetical protein
MINSNQYLLLRLSRKLGATTIGQTSIDQMTIGLNAEGFLQDKREHNG